VTDLPPRKFVYPRIKASPEIRAFWAKAFWAVLEDGRIANRNALICAEFADACVEEARKRGML
jgi:hypothetical protein